MDLLLLGACRYGPDFGSTQDVVLLRICEWLTDATAVSVQTLLRTAAGPTVSYKPYNWKCAAIRYRTFEAANFRTNRSACTIS